MREGVQQIATIGFIERTLEAELGTVRSDVRQMLEDAIYYLDRVVERDEPDLLFQYYAVDSYDPDNDPSGPAAIAEDDPLFACDYYYPEDPFRACGIPCDQLAYQLYLIDEDENGEFTPPIDGVGLSEVKDGSVHRFMINDECLKNPGALVYRGCLDLNKPYADSWDYWDMDWHYWGYWLKVEESDYLAQHLPGDRGLWTSTETIGGWERIVISTGDFRKNVSGLSRFLHANGAGIVDADSDGLADESERLSGTDPFHPDSDGDGCRDGDEVAGATDPTDPTSYP